MNRNSNASTLLLSSLLTSALSKLCIAVKASDVSLNVRYCCGRGSGRGRQRRLELAPELQHERVYPYMCKHRGSSGVQFHWEVV
jgi:hypothetical protein